jgi:hypothetical protein
MIRPLGPNHLDLVTAIGLIFRINWLEDTMFSVIPKENATVSTIKIGQKEQVDDPNSLEEEGVIALHIAGIFWFYVGIKDLRKLDNTNNFNVNWHVSGITGLRPFG